MATEAKTATLQIPVTQTFFDEVREKAEDLDVPMAQLARQALERGWQNDHDTSPGRSVAGSSSDPSQSGNPTTAIGDCQGGSDSK